MDKWRIWDEWLYTCAPLGLVSKAQAVVYFHKEELEANGPDRLDQFISFEIMMMIHRRGGGG